LKTAGLSIRKCKEKYVNMNKKLIFALILLPLVLYANESPLPMATSSSESTSPINRDISVPLQEYIDLFRVLATEDSEVNWQLLLQPVSSQTDSKKLSGAFTTIDSLQTAYRIYLPSVKCELWTAWQIGMCNLELATGKYPAAVERHSALFDLGLSCVDHQSMWWHLTGNYSSQLREQHHYNNLADLLEEIAVTFPSGPARQMRSELTRLKYRLGTLEWSKAIQGTLGEASLGGIASHYRDFITTNGDTLTYLIGKTTVIVCNGEVWVPWVGFTPKQDFESEYRGGDPFSVSYPIDAGKPVVFYLDSDGEVVLIELNNSPTQE
jgi:hypothetical protein